MKRGRQRYVLSSCIKARHHLASAETTDVAKVGIGGGTGAEEKQDIGRMVPHVTYLESSVQYQYLTIR
jgi:hypothetical protein